jgi:hypothetical protein
LIYHRVPILWHPKQLGSYSYKMRGETIITKKTSKKGSSNNPPKREITTVVVQTKKAKNNSKKNNKRTKAPLSDRQAIAKMFKNHLLMPDIYGPIRIPRSGLSPRTLLGIDTTYVTLKGNVTNTVNGIQIQTTYQTNSALQYAVTSVSAAFGTPSQVAWGNQYPTTASVADVALNAACMTVQYSGTPFNASDEIIIGKSLPVSSAANFNSMLYYPGTQRIQMAQFYDKPLRMASSMNSPICFEFLPVNQGQGDVELPFVFLNSANTAISIIVEITRIWECRPTTASGTGSSGYDTASSSYSTDEAIFSDTMAELNLNPESFITPYLPGDFSLGALSFLPAVAGVGALARKHFIKLGE